MKILKLLFKFGQLNTSDLAHRLGANYTTTLRNLDLLEKEGLITKHVDASSFPVKSEYELTKIGIDFISIIKDIKNWALRWKINNKVCEQLDCKNCDL